MKEPTAANPIYYEPPGVCIYCGKTAEILDKGLSDEHIVPYSINGGWIFRKASCRRCAEIINNYEKVIGRELFGNFRIHYGYNTRNPEERPPSIPITVNSHDGEKEIEYVPRSEFPAPFLFFKFAQAGVIEDKPKTLCRFEPTPLMICDGNAIDKYKQNHPEWDGIFKIRACQLELGRLIAKICHGHAVAILKWGAFTPLLQNIILCKTNKLAYLVGGEENIPPATPGKEHFLSIYFKIMSAKRVLIVVNIRLFGQCGTPVFHGVAGEFNLDNPTHLRAFTEHMKDAEPLAN